MPIINIRFIKDVVATEEQKAELIVRMTDTFVDVLGDVVRPFIYTIIDEVPIGMWGIGGVPMPDLPYLTGDEFAAVREKSNQMMRDAIEQMAADADSGQGVTASMSTSEEAKEIIRRWNEEGWSGGKYELAHEIISPNMMVHGAGGQAVGMGPDGLIDLIKTWRTAFPDGRMEIDALIVEGDIVAIRNTWHGTQTAEFYGIPPSGKSVAVTSVGIDRVTDGLVSEGWGELDMVGMMQALGALPIVGPGAVAAGADPSWGPTASSPGGGRRHARREPGHPPQLRRGARERRRRRGRRARRRGRVRGSQPRLRHAQLRLRARAASAPSAGRCPTSATRSTRRTWCARETRSAAHSVVRGTHTGEALFGAEPSGNEVVWTHSDFVRLAGNRIVERWTATDLLTLFQQAGVLPSMGG